VSPDLWLRYEIWDTAGQEHIRPVPLAPPLPSPRAFAHGYLDLCCTLPQPRAHVLPRRPGGRRRVRLHQHGASSGACVPSPLAQRLTWAICQDSYNAAKGWVKELERQLNAGVAMALCGNKADLASLRQVATKVGPPLGMHAVGSACLSLTASVPRAGGPGRRRRRRTPRNRECCSLRRRPRRAPTLTSCFWHSVRRTGGRGRRARARTMLTSAPVGPGRELERELQGGRGADGRTDASSASVTLSADAAADDGGAPGRGGPKCCA
jgi:hypothetical protein